MLNAHMRITSARIRMLRLRLRLTQQQFAERLGVSHVTISRWETGKNLPDALAERALSALLRETQQGGRTVQISLSVTQLAAVLEALTTSDTRLDEAKETQISAAIVIFQEALDKITHAER